MYVGDRIIFLVSHHNLLCIFYMTAIQDIFCVAVFRLRSVQNLVDLFEIFVCWLNLLIKFEEENYSRGESQIPVTCMWQIICIFPLQDQLLSKFICKNLCMPSFFVCLEPWAANEYILMRSCSVIILVQCNLLHEFLSRCNFFSRSLQILTFYPMWSIFFYFQVEKEKKLEDSCNSQDHILSTFFNSQQCQWEKRERHPWRKRSMWREFSSALRSVGWRRRERTPDQTVLAWARPSLPEIGVWVCARRHEVGDHHRAIQWGGDHHHLSEGAW